MRSVRNSSFARLLHSGTPEPPIKSRGQFLGPLLGILIGSLLSLTGIWLQQSLANSAELKRAEREALLDTLTFKRYENQPDPLVQADLAFTAIRHITYSNAESLKEQAAYLRANKFCHNEFTEQCKSAMVEWVASNRRQLGLDPVSPADLRLLLDRPINQLEDAVNRGRKFGLTSDGDPAQQ